MNAQSIDEIIFDTGVKVGAQSPTQLLADKETSTIKEGKDIAVLSIGHIGNKFWSYNVTK